MEERREYPYTPEHVHDYFGRTSVNMDHFHTFVGSTAVQQNVAGGHVHNYANETRVTENHTHIMNGTSGLPVPVLLGHVHEIAGTTTVSDNHTHTYNVHTGYQRPPRNVRRPRPFGVRAEAKAEGKEEPAKRRPRLRFLKKDSNPSSEEK